MSPALVNTERPSHGALARRKTKLEHVRFGSDDVCDRLEGWLQRTCEEQRKRGEKSQGPADGAGDSLWGKWEEGPKAAGVICKVLSRNSRTVLRRPIQDFKMTAME